MLNFEVAGQRECLAGERELSAVRTKPSVRWCGCNAENRFVCGPPNHQFYLTFESCQASETEYHVVNEQGKPFMLCLNNMILRNVFS